MSESKNFIRLIPPMFKHWIVKIILYVGNVIYYRRLEQLPSHFKVKRILAFRMEHLGDVLTSAPALRALKRKYPKAKLELVCGSWTKKVTKDFVFVDQLIIFDLPHFDRQKKHIYFHDYKKIFYFVLRLFFGKKYDIVIDFRSEGPFCYFLLIFACRSKIKIGWNYSKKSFFLNLKIPPCNEYEVDRCFRLLEPLGVKERNKSFGLEISREDVAKYEIFFKSSGININEIPIAIHPGAPWIPRRWPRDNFCKICLYLIQKYLAKILLFGDKYEAKLNEYILNFLREKKQNAIICEELPIQQVACLIKRSALFIGNDSVLMHIAYFVETPIIALFGPGDVNRWAPRSQNSLIITSHPFCSPCDQSPILYPGNRCMMGRPFCMEEIRVEEVIEAIDYQLSSFKKNVKNRKL